MPLRSDQPPPRSRCRYCNQEVPDSQLAEHIKTCPSRPTGKR